jgi:hypothetical protein
MVLMLWFAGDMLMMMRLGMSVTLLNILEQCSLLLLHQWGAGLMALVVS